MSFVRLSQRLSVKHIRLAHVFHKNSMNIVLLGLPSNCFWLPPGCPPGCCQVLLAASGCFLAAPGLLLAAPSYSWLLQAASGCSWLLMAVSGRLPAASCCTWLLLAAPSCSWLLLVAFGCFWAILVVSSVKTMVLFAVL